MGFLSDLTLVQRAGGAAVLVLLLVLLLVRQRHAKGAPAAAKLAGTPKATKSKTSGAAPMDKKARSFGLSRKGKVDDVVEELVTDLKAGQGRMVPRLPAASEALVGVTLDPADPPEAGEVADHSPVAVAANGMINEPGWPTPGEVWAAPDAPVRESAEVESWQDEALAALATETAAAPAAGWASDAGGGIDAAAGWDGSPDGDSGPAGQSDATWQAEEETFDWATGDAIDGWATSDASTPVEDLTSDAAAWEAPDDEILPWSETREWETAEQVEETQPVTTAVVEELRVGDWAAPAEGVVAVEIASVAKSSGIVWDPVDEFEDVEDVVADAAQVVAGIPPVVELVSQPVAVSAPEPMTETAPEVAPDPVMERAPDVAAPLVERPHVMVLSEMPAVADDDVRDVAHSDAEVAVPVASAAVIVDPAARWASMAPGGVVEERHTSSPVHSWTRLRPGRTLAGEAGGANGHRQSHSPVVTVPAPVNAPAPAWWDVPPGMESDPRRGRFALGGYALQAGHQVVSGATFRDGVVPPPSRWVIGPVVGGVAPGTLVLHVDGLLNCRAEDLAVLTDPGFAPTTDGFSLSLAAAATGPFAASGTYIIT